MLWVVSQWKGDLKQTLLASFDVIMCFYLEYSAKKDRHYALRKIAVWVAWVTSEQRYGMVVYPCCDVHE